MAYTATPQGDMIRIYDAITGAPHFNIAVGMRGLNNYYINGNTLTIAFKTGATEVWDLSKRSKIR